MQKSRRRKSHGKPVWYRDNDPCNYHGGNRIAKPDSKELQREAMRVELLNGVVAAQRVYITNLLRSVDKIVVHRCAGRTWGDFLRRSPDSIPGLSEKVINARKQTPVSQGHRAIGGLFFFKKFQKRAIKNVKEYL